MTERVLDTAWLRQVCRDAGADDVGFVEIGRAELGAERDWMLTAFPATRSAISIVCRTNREPIRSPARSIANVEFHAGSHRIDEATRRIVAALEREGVRALNPAMGFPMEMQEFGEGRTWVVSHKTVAVAAGLGAMGIHRNVIHPRFGSFVVLSTVLVGADITETTPPLDFNPCVECKLCVAACPVGAISPDGDFNFSSCLTHNYREFMGGFTDWVETVVASDGVRAYRDRVTPGETASLWQSLAYGANYKAAYCVAVCPAGEDVIAPFRDDRARFVGDIVRPLQRKVETVYVTAGSDAEAHVTKRFPHKRVKRVGNGLRPTTIGALLRGLKTTFQPGRAAGLAATYHFTFTGAETRQATVVIRDGTLDVREGLVGKPDIRVRADTATWLAFLAGERGILGAILRRRVRLRGDPRLLRRFGQCFA